MNNELPSAASLGDPDNHARAAMAWLLWHHQGHGSTIGQSMRRLMGMTVDERLSARDLVLANALEKLLDQRVRQA